MNTIDLFPYLCYIRIMKRSEMLLIIESAIDNACGNNGIERLYPEDEYLAYSILNAMETAGMNPPTIVILPTEYNRQEGSYGFEVNQWDDE